jgi:hypothetical protein
MDAHQMHLALGKVLGFSGEPCIVAIVPFARKDDDQIARPRQFAGSTGHRPSSQSHDGLLFLAGCPSGFFPLAHLLHADDWVRHRQMGIAVGMRLFEIRFATPQECIIEDSMRYFSFGDVVARGETPLFWKVRSAGLQPVPTRMKPRNAWHA